LPVAPDISVALWPESFSNSAAILCIGAVKLAATATCTSPALAFRERSRPASSRLGRFIGFVLEGETVPVRIARVVGWPPATCAAGAT
jgi:hypothetical protein